MWGESRYNVLVKQVEGCGDMLRQVADTIEPMVGQDPQQIAPRLLRQLRQGVRRLDRLALQMLANYDPFARQQLKEGIVYDVRRRLLKQGTNGHQEKPRRKLAARV